MNSRHQQVARRGLALQGRRDLNSQPSVLERAENPPTTPKTPSKLETPRDSSGFDPLYAGPMMGKMMGKIDQVVRGDRHLWRWR